MNEKRVIEVAWTEESDYVAKFTVEMDEEDWEEFDLDDPSAVHELLDHQQAWDQVSAKEWLAPLAVNDRNVRTAREV